jgi:hypothetical protein
MASEKRNLWTVRLSYLDQAKHINDVFLNLGYNYKGKILKSGTSPELWANPLQIPMYSTIEGMITFLIENTKTIKKWFSIAHDKNTTLIN